MRRVYLIPSMLLFMFNVAYATDENVAPELHIDPFINPLLIVQIKPDVGVENISTGIVPAVEKTPRASFLFQPELRGIILSEDIAIANIGGEMIGLGEKYEGYRLIKVKGQSVVFEKNGKQYPVSLDGTDEEEDTL